MCSCRHIPLLRAGHSYQPSQMTASLPSEKPTEAPISYGKNPNSLVLHDMAHGMLLFLSSSCVQLSSHTQNEALPSLNTPGNTPPCPHSCYCSCLSLLIPTTQRNLSFKRQLTYHFLVKSFLAFLGRFFSPHHLLLQQLSWISMMALIMLH